MICGLLAWYDEPAEWLAESVRGAAALCDHVLAVDGAYALFPDARPRSPREQSEAILEAAYGTGIGCTLHLPTGVWMGNQIEKRTLMFTLGREIGADWFFVFDADDLVVRVPADADKRLMRAEENVAVYTLGESLYHRGLFRSLPDLRVEDVHYHYLAEQNGKTVHLRGKDRVHSLEPFLDLSDLKVRHRTAERSPERRMAQSVYRNLVAEET